MKTTLTPNEHLLIEHVSNGTSVRAAAKQIGIDYATARRWLKRPHVAEALDATQARVHETIEQTAYDIITTKYKDALESTCDVVIQIAQNDETPPAARLKAAQMIQDRLAPVIAQPLQPQDTQQALDAILMQYMTDEEITMIEAIMERARVRKAEAEEKITPIRREA